MVYHKGKATEKGSGGLVREQKATALPKIRRDVLVKLKQSVASTPTVQRSTAAKDRRDGGAQGTAQKGK